MKRYIRIIPIEMTSSQNNLFERDGLIYHMLSTRTPSSAEDVMGDLARVAPEDAEHYEKYEGFGLEMIEAILDEFVEYDLARLERDKLALRGLVKQLERRRDSALSDAREQLIAIQNSADAAMAETADAPTGSALIERVAGLANLVDLLRSCSREYVSARASLRELETELRGEAR